MPVLRPLAPNPLWNRNAQTRSRFRRAPSKASVRTVPVILDSERMCRISTESVPIRIQKESDVESPVTTYGIFFRARRARALPDYVDQCIGSDCGRICVLSPQAGRGHSNNLVAARTQL